MMADLKNKFEPQLIEGEWRSDGTGYFIVDFTLFQIKVILPAIKSVLPDFDGSNESCIQYAKNLVSLAL